MHYVEKLFALESHGDWQLSVGGTNGATVGI
jgi:hypothetical protein